MYTRLFLLFAKYFSRKLIHLEQKGNFKYNFWIFSYYIHYI